MLLRTTSSVPTARADLDLAAGLHSGLTRDRFEVRVDSHPGQLAAARAGLGLAVVQRPIGLADPSLRHVLPQLTVAALDTSIVTHEDLRNLPRVRAVFGHLVTVLRAMCGRCPQPVESGREAEWVES